MQASNDDLISISSPELSLQLSELGAEMVVLRDAQGRDLLWNGDPAYWTGHAPLLFPIVGALAGGAYRLGRDVYHLPQHGFARRLPFHLQERGTESVSFRLTGSDATREVYPFPFQLDVSYALAGPTLTIQASVSNTGRRPMPMALGLHPAFRWPLPYGGAREEHEIAFEFPENGQIWRPDADGLLIGPRRTPVRDSVLPLSDELLADGALIFTELASRRVSYGVPGKPRIVVDFPAMPSLGIWSKPGATAPFVCIEPWQGYADMAPPPGEAPKPHDLFGKPGMIELAPGETRAFSIAITLEGAA